MNTSLLTGTILLLAVYPAAALAQSPAPAPPLPRTETLRFKFTAGETLYYTVSEETDGYYREPHGKLTPINSHLEMHLHQTTTDVREADGVGLVDFGIDSMTVTVDKKPPDTSANPAVLANLAKLAVLPTGKLTETLVNPAFNADESLPGEDPAFLNTPAELGELPPVPVQVGSVWKSAAALGLIGEKTAAELTLTGWEKDKEGASVAVIKQTLHGTFGTPPVDAAHPATDMKLGGWTAGTRTVRFNLDTGAVESEDSTVLMTVLMTPRGEDLKFTQPPTQMWVKVISKLTRTPAPAAK